MLCGLAWLHRGHVLHRDVRLENVLLSSDGHVKLCDYGIPRKSVGAYTAPEVFKNQNYTDKADVWAVGCVVYYLCCLDVRTSLFANSC